MVLLFAASTVFGETSLVVEELAQTPGNASRGSVKITLNTSEASDAPTALQLDLKFDPNKVNLTGVSLEGDAEYVVSWRVLSGGIARVVISSQRLEEIVSGTSFRIDAATVAGGAFESLQPFELSGVSVAENQSGSSVTTRVNKVRLKGTALDSLGLVALNSSGGSVLGKIQILATDDAGEVIPKSVFQSGRKRYALGVPTGTISLSVNPVAKDSLAEVRVGFNGNTPELKPSGASSWKVPLEGLTGVVVRVKLDDYETVYEARMLGSDASLLSVKVVNGDGEKSLDAGVSQFTGRTAASEANLKFSLKDSRSTLKARRGGVWQILDDTSVLSMPLVIGDNSLDLVVTSESGMTSNLYSVNLVRSSLQFAGATAISPVAGTALVKAGFISSGGARIVESGVLYSQASGDLAFVDPHGNLPSGVHRVVGANAGGEVSARIQGLSDGSWRARPYLKTEFDEYLYGDPKDFKSEGAGEVNQLSALSVLGRTLSPTFSKTIFKYTISGPLSFSDDSILIYAKASSPETTELSLTVNGASPLTFKSGSIQGIGLKVGTNILKVKVGSGEYTVTVERPLMKGLTADAIGTWEAVLGRGTDLNSAVGLGGLLKVTTLKSGKCTVRLTLGSDVYTWSGEAIMDTLTRAKVDATIQRPRLKDSIRIVFSLGSVADSGSEGLIGSLSGVPGLPDDKLEFAGAKQMKRYASGVQNFSVDRSNEGNVPGGWGFGSFKRTNTTVAYAMSLADGTAVTGSSSILEGSRVAVFSTLYRGTGSVFGLVKLQDGTQALGGELNWFKRKQSGVNRGYGEGFGPLSLALEGGEYKVPVRSTNLFGDQKTTDCVIAMAQAFEGSAAQLSVANQLTFEPGFLSGFGVSRFTSRFAVRDGLVSGGFDVVDPETGVKRSARYFGMLIPGTDKVRGYLLIPSLPGPTQGQVLSDYVVIERKNL
jgi:hypothetical protein